MTPAPNGIGEAEIDEIARGVCADELRRAGGRHEAIVQILPGESADLGRVALAAKAVRATLKHLRTRPASQSAGGVETLVERLRAGKMGLESGLLPTELEIEAADTLEALSREVEALTRRCGEKDDRIAKLEEGLRHASNALTEAGDQFEDRQNADGWDVIFMEKTAIKGLLPPVPASLLKGPADGPR